MPPSPFPEFEIGAVLDGRFEVLRLIGQGAMGIVLEAKHLGLRQRVALKILRPDVVASPGVAARFVREAHAAARLKSEHVVRIMDVGKLASGVPYIVMERLEGADLSRRLLERRRLGFDEVADYLFQTLEALAEAHRVGVIHRDLKPANLFVAKLPGHSHCIKVLDFGISKLSALGATTETEITAARTVLGSPLYMSPEQLEDARTVEPGSDIWSLGVIAYELLTGSPPFQADTLKEFVEMVKKGEFAPLAEQCPHAPPEFLNVIERCLEPNPERRFISAKAVTVALAPWANTPERMVSIERILHVRSSRPPKPSESSRPPPRVPEDRTIVEQQRRDSQPREETEPTPRVALLAAGALLAGVCTLAWLATRGDPESKPAAPPAGAHSLGSTGAIAPPPTTPPQSAERLDPSPRSVKVTAEAPPKPADPPPPPATTAPPAPVRPKARAPRSVTRGQSVTTPRTSPSDPAPKTAVPKGSSSDDLEPLPARPLDEGNPFRR